MSDAGVLNTDMNTVIPEPNVQPEKSVPHETVGRGLKHAREEKNMSLDEAARATKIRKDFLFAIEEDRFELLPGDVFARGFVRSYADFLGLDGKVVATRAAENLSDSRFPTPPLSGASRGLNVTRLVGLVSVGAAAAAVWYFQRHGM